MQHLTNAALEFHDSEVESALPVNDQLVVAFSAAYIHRSAGVPGVDSGEGYVAPLSLIFERASWLGDLQSCQGNLSDGEVRVDGRRFRMLPLPFLGEGSVTAKLHFQNGSSLEIGAALVRCEPTGRER